MTDTICKSCSNIIWDEGTGQWRIPLDGAHTRIADGKCEVAFRCGCGAWYTETHECVEPRIDHPVGDCKVCGRRVTLRMMTRTPVENDGRAIQVPGFGVVCTGHAGVVAFYREIEHAH